jgi:hypothetical protein
MRWEEKLFWISRGFRTTITIEIACPADGLYRAELTQEQEYYACPACASPCRATIICEGVTRRLQLNPPHWRLVSRPLERFAKLWLLASPDELVKLKKPRPRKPLLSKGRRRLLTLRALGK